MITETSERLICVKCHTEKDRGQFESHRRVCRQCRREWKKLYRAEHQDKIEEYNRKYRAINGQKMAEYNRNSYIKNREKDSPELLMAAVNYLKDDGEI